MRRIPVFAVTLLLAAAACSDESPMTVDPQLSRSAATGPAGEATYRVTVHNLTEGQPFTPPLATVHRRAIEIFEVGSPASEGVQQIAENGNPAPMLEILGETPHAVSVVGAAGPVLPGGSAEVVIDGMTGAKYLSLISMLICTNDGFTGVSGIRLPKEVGQSTTVETAGYDAGTEINTEDWADIVPPCSVLTGVESDEPGTGMTNPDLAEGGVVRIHPGIDGDTDLDAELHGWTDPVARIVVERIG